MEVQTIYVGIPIVAFFCFVFLFLAFLNMPKVKAVGEFRWCIISAIIWSGTSLMMRMQVEPGMDFWFRLTFLGILLVPISVYAFLFEIMGIQKKVLIATSLVISVVVFIVNCYNQSVLAVPQMIKVQGDVAGYSYVAGIPIKLLILFELALLIYVTAVAHIYIVKEQRLAKEIIVTLVGIISVFVGMFFKIFTGYMFPFGSLGGIIMAICITYVMYCRHRFDLYNRVVIGLVYLIAFVGGSYPLWNMPNQLTLLRKWVNLDYEQMVTVICVVVCAWFVIALAVGSTIAKRIERRKREKQHKVLQKFQADTASLFQREELYSKLLEVMEELYPSSEVWIYTREDITEDFQLANTNSRVVALTEEEQTKMRSMLRSDVVGNYHQISLLKYDKIVWGFIYMIQPSRSRLNFEEIETYREIGYYASVCLKNITTYQELYQITIQDELTGVYNRSYFETFMTRKNKSEKTRSIMLLDVDDFKLYNELYGERVGDAILKWAGKVLLDTVKSFGDVFRVGSNNFVVYSEEKSREELLEMAEKIREGLHTEKRCRPGVLQEITMSIGIASYPDDGEELETLKKQARKAVDFAKRHGKNKIVSASDDEDWEEEVYNYEKIAPTIYALAAAIDAKDAYTFEHSHKVSEYAVILASELGLPKHDVEKVKQAALLHDIGKIGIPESILGKHGRLTYEEYEVMKTHVVKSIQMIHFLPNMNDIIPAVISHHERYDGKGYPRGLKGDEIPVLGRILTICDCYDAMVSKRPYKTELPVEYAIDELHKHSGTQFDPDMAKVFVSLIEAGRITK